MSELNCDVIFCKNLKFNYTHCEHVPPGDEVSVYVAKESVEIGRLKNVTVQIKDDTTLEEIDALRAEKQNIAAEAQVQMNNLDERIQSLLAIENKSDVA